MSATLHVTPADALIDVPRCIQVRHASPGQVVEIRSTTHRAGVPWHSRARFRVAADGTVDLARDAPVAGDWTGIEPMGLICAQSPAQEGAREMFNDPVGEPLHTEITLEVDGKACARARLVQRLVADGVRREEVREGGSGEVSEGGLVGTLFLPAGPGPHPAIMILNGSGGGMNEPRAALWASRGYAAFALAYFKAPGLSNYISNTPLEYFQKGLRWLRRRVQPAHGFVAISGQSRGGELVLLLGATFPEEVSAVLAYVPGALVHSAQNACDPGAGREGPTWLLGGQPVPHVWEGNRTATWAPFDEGPPPHRHDKAILTALQDPQAVARARIRVERIQAPVLLFSATDDGSWPSSLYGAMVRDKLAEVRHPWPVAWLDFDNAGHSILFPFVPTTQLVYPHPVSGKISTTGGNPRDNARANQQSWQAARQFLDAALRAHMEKSP